MLLLHFELIFICLDEKSLIVYFLAHYVRGSSDTYFVSIIVLFVYIQSAPRETGVFGISSTKPKGVEEESPCSLWIVIV